MTSKTQPIVRTPWFPEYSVVRQLLAIWADTTTKSAAHELINTLLEQTGTPQNPVDWSNPDEWIGERLTGSSAELAARIWTESEETVNPRYLHGAYLFINAYQLLAPDSTGIYRLSPKGKAFLDGNLATEREIDEAEGLPNLLSILASHSPAKRGDLLDDWGAFLQQHSNYGTPSTIKDTLRRRIRNLVERGFITREGNTYTITEQGIAYAAAPSETTPERPHHEVLTAIKRYNDVQIQALRERLGKMDPYRFEALIRDLLEAMDYEDVVVTKQSGDKGVDVIANYQFGITQIKEVVQVKRQQGSITRPILDQLRGALPYHQAIRGTIITLGGFAKGCTEAALFPGAAPITLIDGDKLIELLVKHGVGITKRPQTLVEIDDSYFSESVPPDGDEPALVPID